MIGKILILFVLLVLPVVLIYFKVIPFRYKVHTLGIVAVIILLIVIFNGWYARMLGLQPNAVKAYYFPYILFTLVASFALLIVARLLKRKGTEHWWQDSHFLYGFILVSALQEFVFRGFLIPELQSIISIAWLVILVNALLFAWMHVIYSDDLKSLMLIFLGGIGFASMYVHFPSLILISISHMILNVIVVYFGFFTQERASR